MNALQKPLQLSEELAAVVGSGPLPRGQVVSKMWEYIGSYKSETISGCGFCETIMNNDSLSARRYWPSR